MSSVLLLLSAPDIGSIRVHESFFNFITLCLHWSHRLTVIHLFPDIFVTYNIFLSLSVALSCNIALLLLLLARWEYGV
jgi:hypothetical protein